MNQMRSDLSRKGPPPVKFDPDLFADAACRGTDLELWFRTNEDAAVAEAKAICATCPLQLSRQCLAIFLREPYGVFGGLTPEERWRLLRRVPLPVPDLPEDHTPPAVAAL